MEADAPNVQDKTAKRANNSQEFAQTKELVAPLTPKRTKMAEWCKKMHQDTLVLKIAL